MISKFFCFISLFSLLTAACSNDKINKFKKSEDEDPATGDQNSLAETTFGGFCYRTFLGSSLTTVCYQHLTKQEYDDMTKNCPQADGRYGQRWRDLGAGEKCSVGANGACKDKLPAPSKGEKILNFGSCDSAQVPQPDCTPEKVKAQCPDSYIPPN